MQALRQGTVDVVFMVSSHDSSVIQNMLGVPGLQLANLQKSAAIVECNPYLETSLLPQSALDARIPLRDTTKLTMLTMLTSLVARESLHPALKRLAIATIADTNNKGGLFHRAGHFLSLRRIDFPTAPMSRAALTSGLPWHESLLPFW